MKFRWAAGITLWTFFSGPVFGPPTVSPHPPPKPTQTVSTRQWRADAGHTGTPVPMRARAARGIP